MDRNTPKPISEKLKSSKKILLTTHSRPSIDAVCSLSVLYSVIKNNYKKDVDVAIPSDVGVRMQHILEKVGIASSSILKDLPQRVYVITIKKQGEKIESINFNEEDGKFNFFITPFNGTLDLSSVAINESGSNYDCIITVDTPSLNFLGDLYKKNEGFFSSVDIVSFDNHKSNAGYAAYTAVYDEIDTTSQAILHFLEESGIKLDDTVSTLLYAGMYSHLGLTMRNKVRKTFYDDLAVLVQNKAKINQVHDMLYAPYNINEIFLVGDILDRSNEGKAAKLDNAKVIGCNITLNKEELETVDMDKTAEVVFWNVKLEGVQLGYLLFQRSVEETVGYIYAYDADLNILSYIKQLEGKGDKLSGKVVFKSDVNTAEKTLKEVFGIELTEKDKGKFMDNGFATNENGMFDDMSDDFDFPEPKPYLPPMPSAPIFDQQLSPPSPVPTPKEEENAEQKSSDDVPALFDPRAGK